MQLTGPQVTYNITHKQALEKYTCMYYMQGGCLHVRVCNVNSIVHSTRVLHVHTVC